MVQDGETLPGVGKFFAVDPRSLVLSATYQKRDGAHRAEALCLQQTTVTKQAAEKGLPRMSS